MILYYKTQKHHRMKKTSLLLGIAAMLYASGLFAQESTKPPFYISASAIYATTNWEDVKDGYGAGLAFGTIIKERHFIEAEVMFLKHDMEDYNDVIQGVHVKATGDLQQIPVLATYRYDIPLGTDSGWSLQAGGSVGSVMQKVKYTVKGSAGNVTISESDSESKWVAALGGQVNAVYKINKAASVNMGIRTVWTDKSDMGNDSGFTTMVTAGLSFRF